jgi:restriction system protein
MTKQPAKSIQCAMKTVFAAFQILKANGGEMLGRDVIAQIPQKIQLTDWELERYEKTGYVRWESILHFYTIDCMKAGYLQKEKGVWILTPEGEEALKLGEEGLFQTAKKAYRKWRAENGESSSEKTSITEEVVLPEANQSQEQQALLQQYEQKAMEGIQAFVNAKNPYEFQDLVAALLRAMGYYISFNAKRGKDGGIDIIAYSDPLGTQQPRIKVQVKHRPESGVSIDIVKQLVANLNKGGDVGLFVTSGRFTNDSERYSRESHVHVELIDFEKFMLLWQRYYPQMSDEDKNRLPLHPIYFLGVNE